MSATAADKKTVAETPQAARRGKDGKPVITYRPCLSNVVDTERYRVPIDPIPEQRKRDNLATRQP